MTLNGDKDDLQQLLPAGLIIEKRLPDGSFGITLRVRDERSAICPNGRLVVRVISKPSGTKWEEHLKTRMAELAGRFAPHLSPLVEAGRLKNDDWYLGHPLHGESIATKLKREAGQSAGWVERFAEQLLIGLAELHRHGITHGNIRPENVFLDSTSDRPEEFVVHLGDATTGGIAAWSQGEFVGAGNRHYRPADSNGLLTDPTLASDLYAVGILLSELLIGTESVATARAKAEEQKTDLYLSLREYREFKAANGRLRRLIHGLLTPSKEQRLKDASDALSVLRRPSRWPRVVLGLATLTTLALLIITTLCLSDYHRLEKLRGELEKELSSTKQSLLDSQTIVTELKDKLSVPKDRISALEQNTSTKLTPLDPATLRWGKIQELIGSDPLKLISVIESEAKRAPLPKECLVWSKLLEGPIADFVVWEHADPQNKLKPLLFEAIKSPWDEVKYKAVASRIEVLNVARSKWQGWTNDPAQTLAAVKDVVERWPKEDERQIFDSWIAAFSDKTKWQIRLIEGKIFGADNEPGGHSAWRLGKFRRVTIYQNNAARETTKEFTWENPFHYDFGPDDILEFEWHPGESLGVYLERGEATGIPGLPCVDLASDDRFNGPFALQKLHWQGNISSDGVMMTFEVVDCPGPPLPKPLLSKITP